ncbi:hypothetical protein OPQ81_003109 [Rhizoctonia solani]|nr:hypothetical protein OPQ81_003109 [Rhizoctonia solani]
MAKSQSRVPRTVVKEEENESTVRWIKCKARMVSIWKELPAVPSVESRRALATTYGVDPAQVHRWFRGRRDIRARNGTLRHPQDGYTLAFESFQQEEPSSSASLDFVAPLDNPSSPSYLPMSSPPPQTPMDLASDFPVTVTSGTPFNPLGPPLIPILASSIWVSRLRFLNLGYLPENRFPRRGKTRRIILRVAPNTQEGPSKRSRKDPEDVKPPTKAVQAKKKRRAKKVPKIKQEDQEGSLGLQGQSALDLAGPMTAFPQTFPAGFCAPYFTCINPAMVFGAGITAGHNIPHSFGNMMYNPFTGAPLFSNMLTQFPAFPNQPSFLGQTNSQIPAPSMQGPSLNVPGNASMDQNSFAGNFQWFQSDMSADGAINIQKPGPPDTPMSMIDFLNEPLDAGWTYT